MTDRYATNAFTNFTNFEEGVFRRRDLGKHGETDNPAFIYPSKTLKNAATGTGQKIQRGYMRMIASGMTGAKSLSKRRLHFQFNPDSIVRSVTARNDIQFWMNQDPSQLMQPIPGDANFAFELLFNREPEVVSGSYSDNGVIKESAVKANLPLGVSPNKQGVEHKDVTDIGVLADLIVFDEIIGQGINTKLIDVVLKNAEARSKLNQTKRGSTSNNPTSTAQLTAKVSGGSVTGVTISTAGSGYTTSPTITFSGGGGSGAAIDVTVSDGKITKVTLVSGGSGYTTAPTINLTGGGNGTGTSSSGTSDSEDSAETTVFDSTDARTSLENNFGNSAFLVSTPIRIVFSSLFMVEGYVTSTIVTFNKFNANMVPTQCSVGISMQALYIGFAKKDTFLTLTLKELQEEYDNAGNTDERTTKDLQKAVALGKKLFTKVYALRNNVNHDENRPSPKKILSGDYTQTLTMGLQQSSEFLRELSRENVIKQLNYEMSWDVIYRGNTLYPSGTPIPESVTTYEPGERIWNDDANPLMKNGSFARKDIYGKRPLIKQQFKIPEGNTPTISQKVDTTSTSRYEMVIRVKFYLELGSGDIVECKQQYILNGIVSWNDDTTLRLSNGSLFVPDTLPDTKR